MLNMRLDEVSRVIADAGWYDKEVIVLTQDITEGAVQGAIRQMHEMYSLPTGAFPMLANHRHEAFTRILKNEVTEGEDIAAMIADFSAWEKVVEDLDPFLHSRDDIENIREEKVIAILTAYADWLADIQIYCSSELRRLGLSEVVCRSIIGESNLTKLAEDGSVIRDDDGKVCKGPHFRKPEPTLAAVIRAARRKGRDQNSSGDPNECPF